MGAAGNERRGEAPKKSGVQVQDSPSEGLPGLSHRAPGKAGERAHAEETPRQVSWHALAHAQHFATASLLRCESLSFSTSQSDPILSEGVPALTELHKLEFE